MDVRANIEEGIQAIYGKLDNRQSEIVSTLGITEDDYFTHDKLLQRIDQDQSLKDIQADASVLKADLSTISLVIIQRVLPLIQRIEDASVDRLAETDYPQILTAKLLNLLLEGNRSLGQALSYDNLLISVSDHLCDEPFRNAFKKMLSEPMSDEPDAPLIGTYIHLKDDIILMRGYIRHGKTHKYSAEYSEKGIGLIQSMQLADACADDRIELNRVLNEQVQQLKKLEEVYHRNEEAYEKSKQKIINYFSRSQKRVNFILNKIQEIDENIKNVTLQSDIISSASCDLVDAYVTVSQKALSEAKRVHSAGVLKYGNAPAWVALDEKINEAAKKVELLIETAANQRASLDLLTREKKLRDEQIKLESTFVLQTEEPIESVPKKQLDEDEETVKLYYEKTCSYSLDLCKDMKKKLIHLKKTALWGQLKLPDSIDFALNELKTLYDMSKDKDPTAIARRKLIGERLQAAKQEGLKEGLEKYNGLVTKLLDALGNPKVKDNYAGRKANFMGVLRHADTQALVARHRNNSDFNNFLRECGIHFFAIFGKRARGILFFSPRSAQYSQEIEKEEQARHVKRARVN